MKTIVSRLSIAPPTWITPHVVSYGYLTGTHQKHAIKHGTSPVERVIPLYGSGLITFQVACHMFEEMSDLTVTSATAIIGGFAKRHCHEEAVYLFSRMLASTIRPNEFTFGTVVHSSTVLGNVHLGRQLHACAAKIGLGSHVFVGSALLDLYVKLSTMEEALKAFRDTQHPNVVSYTTMISANIAALGIGKSFHACAIKFLGKLDGFVGNSLISFYAKCGSIEESLLVFNKLLKRNIVSWNALICGYAQNGRGVEAIRFFERMRYTGPKPNEVTLLGLLLACNHAGLVDEGYSYFNQARLESPNLLKPEHYACMVDLLARSGRFTEAKHFLQSLHFDPGIGFWKALLGGCQIHSNMELGELAARKILALDPDDVSSYVMLSNAHSAAARWSDVSMLRTEMKEKGLKRIPGCSWIEVTGKVHVFLTADHSHTENEEIYVLLGIFYEHYRENEASDLLNIHCNFSSE
ncbi:hypothetical protein Ahy_A05g021918 isoform A [Arachis hypogaea]|uniref:Pentatricopeptide repeat-containing protein n=1 Tax=Arachis hypogaea TaxID=3818 RepID=A0A445CZ00_ARAHY|nr:hypothetical protein Ahy_A05g021918 isoform A [Arachis hypogaea]